MLPISRLNRIRSKTHGADADGENLAMQLLQRHLAALDPGAIADIGKLAALLGGCWRQFEGTHAQGMSAGKLTHMEALHWEPPLLSFASSATALAPDLRRLQASCIKDRGYRQLRPGAEPVSPSR
jgi:hypothetical protein